jgi:hypothetical protein
MRSHIALNLPRALKMSMQTGAIPNLLENLHPSEGSALINGHVELFTCSPAVRNSYC